MMKATAGKGKVSDIRKVTNSIIAQSGMKKVSTGRTLHARVPWRRDKALVDFGDAVQASTEWRGVVRCAALSGRTAGTARTHCTARHSRALLARRPVLLCARCEAGKGDAGWRSCRRKT